MSFIRCCYAPAQSCAPPLLRRVTVVLSETITTTRGNKSAQASEMLPLKLKCRNAAASAAASSAAPTAAYACSSFVCRPVVCLVPRSVRSCLNYDIVIIKWMHGATAATSAEAGSSSSSICCVCLIVHSRRHLMPHNVCVYLRVCVDVSVGVCACAATACQS